jgi:hypothetical protein
MVIYGDLMGCNENLPSGYLTVRHGIDGPLK